ncbi:MAG: hypothetical protein A2X84_14460 [Desulfuromonadaceae bacterium GWC2_58_13]|nr:MAG: hypothetical protein A2X84_14460 [Desulfuromonadaceae bacterium GWC2_58_13]
MAGKDVFFTLMLLAALALAAGCWLLDRRLEQAKKKLAEREQLLHETLERLRLAEIKLQPKPKTGSVEFEANLAQADLKQRLKGGDGPSKNVPEKYRLVAAMARRGLPAADIAEILEISPGEAEQLLKLVRVAQTES